ncbi:MAG: aminoacyl-histidine dipeptidase [Calditrichaeota bacterium]|nr:MAG: aminoacyl-histidine dipeptidase [Calditrichota bacterium]
MKEAIAGLEPALLWEHFYQLSQIPRCSKHEEKARAYVIEVAQRNNLEYRTDSAGNVVVKKPATPGMENRPTVVLQSHLDMVCEKNKDTEHDFSRDPIRLKREGDWLTAEGTTLGADNGIGVAAALAVLESTSLKHGPLECLFTIDEETGLTGATMLDPNLLEGRMLLNLDSEEDGAIYIGCAGGRDTELLLALDTETAPAGMKAVRIRVGGLQGGHSGLNIHEGRGNAIKLLARFLWKQAPQLNLRVASIDGGSKHNAIPRECDAVVYLPSDQMDKLKAAAEAYSRIFKNEYRLIDPGVFLEVAETGFEAPSDVLTPELQKRTVNLLFALPHGVIAMSHAVPGLVETSTNLAVVHTEGSAIRIVTSQRSSVQSELDEIVDQVCATGELAMAEIQQGNGYPAWQPNPDSPLLKRAEKVYQDLFGTAPEVKAIHAGLECGIIGDKFPGMDMISFGPTISGAHSPDEKVQISTVEKFWKFLTTLLAEIA